MNRLTTLLALTTIVLFASCTDDSKLFTEFQTFDSSIWAYKTPLIFEFEITDADQAYDLTLSPRYAGNYRYSNLFVKYDLTDSAGSAISGKLHEIELFNKEKTRPLGEGATSVYLMPSTIKQNFLFPSPGQYQLRIEHYMRSDTIQQILAMGLTLSKSEK